MYNLKFKISFYKDLNKILDYIFRTSFSYSPVNKIYNEIMSKILGLKIFPRMYPVFAGDFRVMTIRKRYRIFYKVYDETQEVVIYYIFGAEENYEDLIY